MLNFGNGDTEFPLPSFAARAWSARSEKEKKKKFDKRIVAMPLPKQVYKSFFQQLWQWHCRKWGKKKEVTKSMKE